MDWLVDFVQACFDSIVAVFEDLFAWAFDGILTLVSTIVSAFQLPSEAFGLAGYISLLPPEFLAMWARLGVNQCLSLIVLALTTRFLLQLIPFVRFGS